MTSRRTPTGRIQDLLDGRLSPAEEAALRQELAGSPELEREYRTWARITALLDTPLDMEPPADLVPGVLHAVRARREAPSRRRMPAYLENLLVAAGAFAVAALVAFGRFSGPEVLGRAVVEGTRGFALMKGAVLDLAEWDWTFRLIGTLGRASGTVLGSSAGPLLGFSVAALLVAAVLGLALLRGSRRTGGLGHAHVLA